ncbi:APC family permease [Spiroplasma endosymbiont of Polydrusus pterygomalis]|uniref:APC family permease n=1 Tax=Spiroplasma endosymbiont of Polydrusus pterygomalis TaxID=3139327 RepID=UPI003CCB6863
MFNLKKLKFWKKTTSQANNEKITLHELIWIGFNYTCGIAFPMALIGIYYWNNGGIGLHMLWVILLCALIAVGTALAFTKCSRVYHDTNGGAYVYVRGVFGRFWGWLIGFIQYITLPSTIIVTIISMFRVNLDQLSIFNWTPERWSSLIIDSIGNFIYGVVASFMYFGMKGFRWFVNISGIIKWGSALFLIVCAIILVITNKGLAFSQAAAGTKNIKLTLPKINNAFSGFFYFFIGFETFIVIGKNVKNPTRNFGKGILLILLLSTIFYLVVSVLVFGAITLDGTNGNNGWSNATNEYNPNNVISGIAGVTGMIVLVISTLSLKLNGAMQNSLYSGGMIQPLAKEGYITEKLAKLNQENIALRASTANLIITIIACVMMLIIPDLIDAPFDFNTVLGFSTNITICVYIFVLIATCVMGYRQQIKLKIWEWLVFIVCALFLLSQFVVFNYGMINDMINKKGETLIAVIIEFLMFWMFIVIAIIWYFIYYRPKLKMRWATNLTYQQQLDEEFVPMTETEAIKYLLNEPEDELARIKIHETEARSVTT